VLPELGLNTQSSDSSPHAVIVLPIAPRTHLRAALYRESGLVPRPHSSPLSRRLAATDEALHRTLVRFEIKVALGGFRSF
jgi:hypothetical protein